MVSHRAPLVGHDLAPESFQCIQIFLMKERCVLNNRLIQFLWYFKMINLLMHALDRKGQVPSLHSNTLGLGGYINPQTFLSGSESSTLMGCGRLQPFAAMTLHFDWLKLVKKSGTHARPTADRWDSADFFLSAAASLLCSIGTDGRPALGFAAEIQE